MLIPTDWLIRRARVILVNTRRLSVTHEAYRLRHCGNAQRKELIEIKRANRVVGPDRHFALQEDWSRVDAHVRPEHRQSRLRLPLDNRPVDRACASVPWEQRRMVLNRLMAWGEQHALRNDVRHEGHHV